MVPSCMASTLCDHQVSALPSFGCAPYEQMIGFVVLAKTNFPIQKKAQQRVGPPSKPDPYAFATELSEPVRTHTIPI